MYTHYWVIVLLKSPGCPKNFCKTCVAPRYRSTALNYPNLRQTLRCKLQSIFTLSIIFYYQFCFGKTLRYRICICFTLWSLSSLKLTYSEHWLCWFSWLDFIRVRWRFVWLFNKFTILRLLTIYAIPSSLKQLIKQFGYLLDQGKTYLVPFLIIFAVFTS